MVAYVVEALQEVTLDIAGPEGRLARHDLMSPFVWTEGKTYRLLVRVVPNPLGPADPTGIIWGESDRILPVAYADEFKKLIPHADVAVVRRCGHLPQVEKVDDFCEMVFRTAKKG